MNIKDRMLVALDLPGETEALSMARLLCSEVGGFKVGLELFCAAGPGIVGRLRELGSTVFLDLKLHDIPATVGRTARLLTRLGADIINVHAAGGLEMMRAALLESRGEAHGLGRQAPLIVGVTVLTSLQEENLLGEVGVSGGLKTTVVRLAGLAGRAGLDGVVASAREVVAIRDSCGPDFVIITPGLRLPGEEADDQKRTATPAEALAAGASFLVVGRPITRSGNPLASVRRIVSSLTGAGCTGPD